MAKLPPGVYQDGIDPEGFAFDVNRYSELAERAQGPVLELCCGSGRVGLPLAKEGRELVGVDLSPGMLAQFRQKIAKEDPEVARRITLVEQDATRLALDRRDFGLAFVPFNSLLLIDRFEQQRAVIACAAEHLRPGGMFAVDVLNPLAYKLQGEPVPRIFFTRQNPRTGNMYTRFTSLSPVDHEQRQRCFGWYDEVDREGNLKRRTYTVHWRLLFRFELTLMLEQAGLRVESLHGGHRGEPYLAQSPRMFFVARKPEA
jgi:SAM-dependent methyltransferase